MKKLLLLLGLILGTIGTTRADSYTITFSSTAKSATQISTSTKATTFIALNSQEYVDGSPVTAATSAYYGGNTDDEKTWIRIGKSKANGNLTLKLSTKGQVKATSIVISAKKYGTSDADATLTLNGKSETISSATFENKTFTFTGEETLTQLVFSTNAPSNNSSNRIYIQSITINYNGSVLPDPVELGELSATCNEATVESPLTVDAYTPITFHADNATSFQVTVNNDEPIILTASNGSAEWIPTICDNASVSVVAKREVEGEETQTSEPLTFNLTVKKADYIIADWVVTGIPNVSGGSAINNVALICTPNSATGVWKAKHDKSYATTNNNAAQLGSSNNTFNGGTLTLSGSDIPANAIILSISLTGYNNSSTHAVWSIKVGETTADNTITFSNSTATNTADVNLIGNSIVLTCGGGTNIKQTYISGISIKYTIPEEQPGEIVVDYVPQYCLEANDDKTELTVMTGAELRFSSMAAAKMEITTEEEGIELPEAVNEANITWTVPADIIATIKVTASSESGEKTSERVYTICSEDITPEIPEYIFENDSKSVMISTDAGALMIMAAPYTPAPEENASMMAIEAQGWAFTTGDDPKSYEFSYEGMESTMNVSVKSVTPTKESDIVSFYVSNDGQVSGIENVATDVIAGEAVYYNLQGQRVNADRPGMYIRQQGGKAEKFVIR